MEKMKLSELVCIICSSFYSRSFANKTPLGPLMPRSIKTKKQTFNGPDTYNYSHCTYIHIIYSYLLKIKSVTKLLYLRH